MDALIKNVESRSLNFKQTGRQKDFGLSRDNSQESHRMCQRQQNVIKTKFLLVKETEENPIPISIQYRTECIFLLKSANFAFWLYEEWFLKWSLSARSLIQETVSALHTIFRNAEALWMKNRNRTIIEQKTVTICSDSHWSSQKQKRTTWDAHKTSSSCYDTFHTTCYPNSVQYFSVETGICVPKPSEQANWFNSSQQNMKSNHRSRRPMNYN